jgi:tetratricopeptide (TPR) repeat protein
MTPGRIPARLHSPFMPSFPPPLQRHRHRLALCLAIALVLGLAFFFVPRPWTKGNLLLTTPRIALEGLAAKSLYFNGPALPWLIAQRPELLTAEDRDPKSERAQSFAQAVLDPKLFRKLDRLHRFDVLLLIGDPSQYRPLLDHLVETKDFTLAYVDHTSLVFRRSPEAKWAPKDLAAVRQKLGPLSDRETAEFLALTAAKLVAAGRDTEGKALIDEALKVTTQSADTWCALATYELNRGEWQAAQAAIDHALAADSKHLGALAVRTQILYASKRFSEAYDLSRQLIERLPLEPNVLFKHAQIAHEAHAYKAEIATLEQLIGLAEAGRRSTTAYRLYLAQAFAASSQPQPALDNFTRVLADPDLPADQRKFATESVERIKSRTGL